MPGNTINFYRFSIINFGKGAGKRYRCSDNNPILKVTIQQICTAAGIIHQPR